MTDLPTYDFDMSIHPACPADWRHRRAKELIQTGAPLDRETDGPLTRVYADLIRRLRAGDVFAEHELVRPILSAMKWKRNRHIRARLEARILAGNSCTQIAGRENVDPHDIGVFAALYFDVSQKLSVVDFIYQAVVRFTKRSRESLLSADFLMKLAAYELGNSALNLLLCEAATTERQELPFSPLLRLRRDMLILSVKIRVGCARPDQVRNAQWIRQYRRLEKSYRSLERAERQLSLQLAQAQPTLLAVSKMSELVEECERKAAA